MSHRTVQRFAKGALAATFLGFAIAVLCWTTSDWSDPAVAWFEDKTSNAGLTFSYRNGEETDHFTMLETLGGGIGLIDYDQDGLLDIFVTGGGYFGAEREILGHSNRLFKNLGDWQFRDVTAGAGFPSDGSFYSHGCAVGDYNNDGWPDLLVTGYGRMALYENRQGAFHDVTERAGLRDKRPLHWSTSAAWADFNGDGHLDLFVGHYLDWSFANHPVCESAHPGKPRDVCSPDKFGRLAPALFVNLGNGAFRDIAAQAGLTPGRALGVVVLDANNDSWLDIYVANDLTGNNLYLNQGAAKGAAGSGGLDPTALRFEDVAIRMGVAHSIHGNRDGSMGVAVGDYERTGRPSFFVTNFEGQAHGLFRNLGNGFFQHSEHTAGLTGPLGLDRVGWGAGFFDFDLDGSEDLFVSHGHILRFPTQHGSVKQKAALFRNLYSPGDKPGRSRFALINERGGPYFSAQHCGRGVAFGDLDNDGGVDVIISHINQPVTLLRNVVAESGSWLGFDLVTKNKYVAVGAKATLEVDGQTLTRFLLSGGSYLSSSDRRLVFGLGNTGSTGRLTVFWPSGQSQSWDVKDVARNRYWQLVEGDKNMRQLAPSRR
jgi:hypothetical protein